MTRITGRKVLTMDLHETGNLLAKIAIHYPRFETQISDGEGNMRRDVAEEWQRLIGFLSFDEALKKLDTWLVLPDERRKSPPDTTWFVKAARSSTAREHFSAGAGFDRIDALGNLSNEAGMIFAFPDPDRIYEKYHYDGMGRILDSKGRLVRR